MLQCKCIKNEIYVQVRVKLFFEVGEECQKKIIGHILNIMDFFSPQDKAVWHSFDFLIAFSFAPMPLTHVP